MYPQAFTLAVLCNVQIYLDFGWMTRYNFTQAAIVPFVALTLFWAELGEERERGRVAC